MRIVVTGRHGQIVRALLERGPELGHEIVAVGRPELDLAGDPADVERVLEAAKPEAIVSAAAYTAVDKAETERELAFSINEKGAHAIARFASKAGLPLVHLSTDYVFDGTKGRPYREDDPTGPCSVYGESKLAGELQVLDCHDDVAILRTAWVYSPFGSNFVKTMLRLATDRTDLNVVADQFGNPTSALDIAQGLLIILQNMIRDSRAELRGVFHMAGATDASWAHFAKGIFARSAAVGGPSAKVRPIPSAEYQTAAKRPANSRLECRKLDKMHGVTLPGWEASVGRVVGRLIGESV